MVVWQDQPRFLGNCIVVWLAPNREHPRDNLHQSIRQLQQIDSSIQTFVDNDQCIDYVTDRESEKILMIVPRTVTEQFLHAIQYIPQLHAIFVLDDKQTIHDCSFQGNRKVKGVYNDMESLFQVIKHQVNQMDLNLTPISIVPTSSVNDLNDLDQSFMYSQLLKEILLSKNYNEMDKAEFIQFCRVQYDGNELIQNVISEFERDYDGSFAIRWYTRETFLYPMMNKALRTQDIEIIIKMGFFLRDLHVQITCLHANSTNRTLTSNIYRGQGMFNADFDRMSQNVGGLLSFNNFLSTTLDRELAYARADSAQDDPQLTGVFFEIKMDTSISRTPYASIGHVSYFLDSEQEILFSMHTIFRIGQLKQIGDRLWHIILTLTSDDDKQLKQLIEFIRKEIAMQPEWAHLAVLMLRMGEYKKAEEICRAIVASTSINDLDTFVWCLNNMGNIMVEQGDQTTALVYLRKALEIKEQYFSSDQPRLITAHNNIGLLYDSMGQYPTALSHYKKALKMEEQIASSDNLILAMIHNNIGHLHHTMGNYSKARFHLQKALDIRERSLPAIHPDLATIHNNLGDMYCAHGQYSEALVHYEKTLGIQQKSLPSHHRSIGATQNNMGYVYLLLGRYPTSLIHLKEALKIWEETLPWGHSDLAIVNNSIGQVYHLMSEYSMALSYFTRALVIQQKSLPAEHPERAVTYNNIGMVYRLMGDNATALFHLEKALGIQNKCLPADHFEIAKTHNNIAIVYLSEGDSKTALTHMEKVLEIQERSLPSNHPYQANAHTNIGVIYERLGDHSIALAHLLQALKIRQDSDSYNQSDHAYLFCNIGAICILMDQCSDALPYLIQALEIWQKYLPPNHNNLEECHMHLAAAYWSLKRYDQSMQHTLQAMRIASLTSRACRIQTNVTEEELD